MNDNEYVEKINELQVEIQSLKYELSRERLNKEQILQEKNQILNELIETRNSVSYKVSKGLTYIPRKIRGLGYVYGGNDGEQIVYPYMISVVVAVYNTAEFLKDMIESIINQKQDLLYMFLRSNTDNMFKHMVYDGVYELILIDDGSTDGSEDICDEYAQIYPWIKVLHKKNEGVSAARNAGIEIATGKYITFPDSDDILTSNVFEDCFLFFEKHESEVSMVTYPLRFFDAQTGDHWTTYRFENGTRIVDLMDEWDSPQYFTAASFFKTYNIKGKISFDLNLINGEDVKFAHEVIFNDSTKVGLISTCTYMYRRRSSGIQSAIQQSKQTIKYYSAYITDMLGWLMNESKNIYTSTPKFVQYAVMGQLQWRLKSDERGEIARTVIGNEEYLHYVQLIKDLLLDIDIDVILSQRQLFREHKYYACLMHTKGNVQRIIENDNLNFYFENRLCTDIASTYLKLDFLEINNGILRFEGRFADFSDGNLWLKLDDEKVQVEIDDKSDFGAYVLDYPVMPIKAFKVEIELDQHRLLQKVVFGQTINDCDIIRKKIVIGKFMPICNAFSASYYANELWSVRVNGNCLEVWNIVTPESVPNFEEDFEYQIVERFGEDANPILSVRREALCRLVRIEKSKRQIWLVSDRYSHADDNGEAMFLYLTQNKVDNISVYFVIDNESADAERLKGIGEVVAQDSREHHILHLIADCIISSQADEYIINPFWRNDMAKDIFRDFFCRNRYVFLQHGIIKDDLSRWLNRYNKNIDGFICSAYDEAKSILNYKYYYNNENVWLTGMPRYDRLYHNEQKYIIVMPTWRKWLMADFDSAESDKVATRVSDELINTEYYQFYHDLLNNNRLLDACDEYGYKLCFMPHTNLRDCMNLFCEDERIICFDFDKPYRDAFAEANLMVTDYSSTAMDFAYLYKPVIYAQFDYERFCSGEHTYDKGYFEYKRDGFGDVEYALEDVVDNIIYNMQNGCKLSEKYKARIDKFFAYHDDKNCERVSERLLELMRLK